MNSTMTIGGKFSFTAGILLLMMAGMGIGSVVSIKSLSRSVDTIVTDPLPGVQRVSRVDALIFQYRGDTWKHLAFSDMPAKLVIEANQSKTKAAIAKLMQDYEKTITTPRDRELYESMKPLYENYVRVVETEVLPLSRAGKSAEAKAKYLADADPTHAALKAAVLALVEYNRAKGEADAASAQRTAANGRGLILGMLVLGLLSASLLTFFMVRQVNSALSQVAANLSVGAVQVASAASQLTRGSQSLADGATEQAASLEETSASLTEINSMAVSNADKARSATTLVLDSLNRFQETNLKLSHLIAAMGSASLANEKIAGIIKIIDDVAASTNILALNAAVEAARAGVAGTGFAVVADEVRSLAKQSAEAARSTAELIAESMAKFNEGHTSVEIVVKAIQAIGQQSQDVKMLIDEVNLGSYEQVTAMKQITTAMVQMERVTQLTAANAEESASAAEELSSQSRSVLASVQRLAEMISTKAAQSARRI